MQVKIPGARDKVIQAFVDGETRITTNNNRLFSHTVLFFPLRGYYIKLKRWLQKGITRLADQHIKQRMEGKAIDATPLSKVAKAVTNKLPMPNGNNSDALNAHTMNEIFDRFFSYLEFKPAMFQEAFKLIRFELGHDKAYDEAFQILIEEIIKAILAGKWKVRDEEPLALRGFWSAKTPRGGKYSIISILQDKKALESLLGDDWRLKEEWDE